MSLKISVKDKFFHTSINSLGLYLCPECLLNFLSNLCIPKYVGKSFKFIVFTFLEKALIRGNFTHAFLYIQNSPPTFLSSLPRQGEITHSPRQQFCKNMFPLTAEKGGADYYWLFNHNHNHKIWRWLGTLGMILYDS